MNEVWSGIPGYEGLYQVSDKGNVRSLNFFGTGYVIKLKLCSGSSGYLQVTLCKGRIRKTFFVHRLVWEAFNGPIPDGMQINHNNECITDNRLENLSLMTPKENTNWGTGNRRRSKALSRIVEQYTLEGTHIATWFSARGIQEELGYSQGNISDCCNGNRKTAYGYVWKYK